MSHIIYVNGQPVLFTPDSEEPDVEKATKTPRTWAFFIDEADEEAAYAVLRKHTKIKGDHLEGLASIYVRDFTKFGGMNVGWRCFAYSIVHEPVPPYTRIVPTCGNKNCFNPFHLSPTKIAPVLKPRYAKLKEGK